VQLKRHGWYQWTIAETLDVSEVTVSRWLKRARDGGLCALSLSERSEIQFSGSLLFLVHAGIIQGRSNANSLLENGSLLLMPRDSQWNVSGQHLLFVANVHVSFPRSGEAIPQ
jgi:hypothetical protein